MIKFICVTLLVAGTASFATAQNNNLGANDQFYSLLQNIGNEIKVGEEWTNIDMYQKSNQIDKQLAWKYFWNQSSVTAPEETMSNGVGYILNRDKKIAYVLYFEGNWESLFYLVNIHTYNYETGKKIDELHSVAGFTKDGADCTMKVNTLNNIVFTTSSMGMGTTINLVISKKGRIER